MKSQTPQRAQDFFGVLRDREAQAREFGERHLVAVRDQNSMLYWLAEAACQSRKAAGRRQVHIAASTIKGVDQSTIARFEKHAAWPRDPDAIVQAYADDLDVAPADLWGAALDLWRDHQASKPPDEAAAQIAELEAQRNRAKPPAGDTKRPSSRRGSRGR